jgi:hypothetical protein
MVYRYEWLAGRSVGLCWAVSLHKGWVEARGVDRRQLQGGFNGGIGPFAAHPDGRLPERWVSGEPSYFFGRQVSEGDMDFLKRGRGEQRAEIGKAGHSGESDPVQPGQIVEVRQLCDVLESFQVQLFERWNVS